jgi:hypothetical protein
MAAKVLTRALTQRRIDATAMVVSPVFKISLRSASIDRLADCLYDE